MDKESTNTTVTGSTSGTNLPKLLATKPVTPTWLVTSQDLPKLLWVLEAVQLSTELDVMKVHACQPLLYIPLQFWFCRNPGLALPLIALQYHEVKINLEFSSASECYWTSSGATVQALSSLLKLLHYTLITSTLDTDERRRFAQVSHEYLIEQLQFTGDESVNSVNNKIKLNFNHPCKELIWVVQPDSNVDATSTAWLGGRQHFNYTDRPDETYFSGTPRDPLGGGIAGR